MEGWEDGRVEEKAKGSVEGCFAPPPVHPSNLYG